jgi:hypothetical protein
LNARHNWMPFRHFVPLEGKFLLIALVIARLTLNVIVRQMPHQRTHTAVNTSVKCVLCTKEFKIDRYLKEHIKRKHT